MMTRHFATKPVKGSTSKPVAPPSSAPKAKSNNVSSRPPQPPTASALAAKKVVDEIIASRRYEQEEDEEDDEPAKNVDDDDDDQKHPTREELIARSRAGFDPNTVTQLRRWLPRDGKPVTSAVAAQVAKMVNRTQEQHFDVVNLPAMLLFRIVCEAKWHVFLSPTKQGTLLAFSSPEALAAFTPALPKDQFEIMTGYEIGAAIVDDEENTIKGIAFDPPTIQRLKPSLPESRMMLLLHWADSIYFEQFVSAADPSAPVLKPDPEDVTGYDPRVLWHRSYVIGALGGDSPDAQPEDVQLLADSEDRIVVLSAPDHVAEVIGDGRVMPVSLSAEELIGVLDTQKCGISITVGADCDMDDKPTRHKSVTWTNEQALSILRASRPQPGEPGYEELLEQATPDAEIAAPAKEPSEPVQEKSEKNVVPRKAKPVAPARKPRAQ